MFFFSTPLRKIVIVSTIIASVLAYKYLPQVLSIIDVSITANRQEILEKTKYIIEDKKLLKNDYDTAVYFNTNTWLQYYVELECGGKEVFKEIIQTKVAEPYLWVVRACQEGKVSEVTATFTPEGIPFSFAKKMDEMESGVNISKEEAQQLGQTEAHIHWNIDFSEYELHDYSTQEQLGKRIDHIFTYQKQNISLGKEGKYRIKIVISGNQVTEVSPFVFIPESFVRRYQEMSSDNKALHSLGNFLNMIFIYLLGLIGLGLYLWYNKGLSFKNPRMLAFFLALGALLVQFSQWPFLYLHYITSLSKISFIIQSVSLIFLRAITTFGQSTLIYAIAVGATIFVFRNRYSLWNLCSSRLVATDRISWAIVSAYSVMAFHFLYVVGYYLLVTSKYFGYWMPSDTVSNPNVLACYMPWLSSLVMSFSAGTLEESLYRALPLAGAVLVGRYFKQEKICIFLGLILSAVIFASLHATYPSYPGYLRIVELIPMALGYGLVYLRMGLIPVMIAHWFFDLILMGLPVFVSCAPGAWIYKGILGFVLLLPLLYVMYARYKHGYVPDSVCDELDVVMKDIHEKAMHPSSNQVSEPAVSYDEDASDITRSSLFSSMNKLSKYIIILLLSCVVGYASYTYKNILNKVQKPHVLVSKQVVVDHARHEMKHVNPEFLNIAQELVFVRGQKASEHVKFAWQMQGPDMYKNFEDVYVFPVTWTVRYACFTGTQDERAQEYLFAYDRYGHLIEYTHKVSELSSGQVMSEAHAREKVLSLISVWYGKSAKDLKEIVCKNDKKPARLDWVFEFEDMTLSCKEGAARIKIVLHGDELGSIMRYIFIPESWTRANQQDALYKGFMQGLMYIGFFLFMMYAIFIMRQYMSTVFNVKKYCMYVLPCLIFFITAMINNFKQASFFFSTSMSWINNLIPTAVMSLISLLFITLISAFLLIYVRTLLAKHIHIIIWQDIVLIVLAIVALSQGLHIFALHYYPLVYQYTALNSYIPFVSALFHMIFECVSQSFAIYAFLSVFNIITAHGRRRLLSVAILSIVAGAMTLALFSLLPSIAVVQLWLVMSLILILAYYFIIRKDMYTFWYAISVVIFLGYLIEIIVVYKNLLF